MVTIRRITRSRVEFEHEGRFASIEGEGLLRGHGSPDFVLYRNTLNSWAAPLEGEAIDDGTRERLLSSLVKAFEERGMTAEIE